MPVYVCSGFGAQVIQTHTPVSGAVHVSSPASRMDVRTSLGMRCDSRRDIGQMLQQKVVGGVHGGLSGVVPDLRKPC